MTFVLAQNKEADQLLGESSLALLIAMVLDQQIPMERAFIAPYLLQQRLGMPLDADQIHIMDPDRLDEIFSIKPALHRFPSSMAKRVASVCEIVSSKYDNDASNVWTNAKNSTDLFQRITSLPGFGTDKSRIFIALLGKQANLNVADWREVCKPFGEPGTYMSVADIVDEFSLAKVRAFKVAMKKARSEAL